MTNVYFQHGRSAVVVVEKCAGCNVAFTTILKRRVYNFHW